MRELFCNLMERLPNATDFYSRGVGQKNFEESPQRLLKASSNTSKSPSKQF